MNMILFAYITYGIAIILGVIISLIYCIYINKKCPIKKITPLQDNLENKVEIDLSSALKHFKIVNL